MLRTFLALGLVMLLVGACQPDRRQENNSDAPSTGMMRPKAEVTKPVEPMPDVFGELQYSPETGDVGGFQVRFSASPARARAGLLMCEGGCGCWMEGAVRWDGDRFEFGVIEVLTSYPDGRQISHPIQVRGRLLDDTASIEASDDQGSWGVMNLVRQAKAFDMDDFYPACRPS